jgi:hypothetical protein
MIMQKLKWIGLIAAAAVVAMTAGCHRHDMNSNVVLHGEDFPADNDTRAVWQIRAAQAAAGAREDATLYGVHFDDGGLNSLGQRKLELMLADEQPVEPLIVYLDLNSDAAADKDRQSVAAYLKDRGLQDSQIALKDGPNPHAGHSAARALANLQALDAGPNPQSGTPGSSIPVSQNATSSGNPQPTYTSH